MKGVFFAGFVVFLSLATGKQKVLLIIIAIYQGQPTSIFGKYLFDLRSRIFETFVVKFLACLPLLGFSNTDLTTWYNCPFLTDFYPKKVT